MMTMKTTNLLLLLPSKSHQPQSPQHRLLLMLRPQLSPSPSESCSFVVADFCMFYDLCRSVFSFDDDDDEDDMFPSQIKPSAAASKPAVVATVSAPVEVPKPKVALTLHLLTFYILASAHISCTRRQTHLLPAASLVMMMPIWTG